MAPLPQNNTDRYIVQYTTGRVPHEMTFRTALGTSVPLVDAAIYSFLQALQGDLCDGWAVTGVLFQERVTNFTLPVSLPLTEAVTALSGADALPEVQEPREFSFEARSVNTGRFWSVSVYGISLAVPNAYRYGLGDMPPSLLAAIESLQNRSDDGQLVAIDGNPFRVKQYVNVNYNSYWERQARK